MLHWQHKLHSFVQKAPLTVTQNFDEGEGILRSMLQMVDYYYYLRYT